MRAFRAVKTLPATPEAFGSYRALGKAPPRKSVQRDSYDAVSMFTTLKAARLAALKYHLGDWIVEVDLPDDGTVTVGKISDKTGHVDIFGEPDRLAALVVGHFPLVADD